MIIAIPDDYHGLLARLDCFKRLAAHDVLDNALCTPHSAWIEPYTYELYFGEAFDNALAFICGEPVNILNPEVLPHRRREQR